MDRDELILVLKAQQWEKCKGELYALISLDGCRRSNSPSTDKLKQLTAIINDFVDSVEDKELNE